MREEALRYPLWTLLVLFVALGPAGPALSAGNTDYSPAQLALFDTPHLQNITGPATLDYRFEQREAKGDSFEDSIKMTVISVRDDGRKDLSVLLFSGKRERSYENLAGFRGNPLIMLFLQHDVQELARLTGGGSSYFRNRIRHAFRGRSEVSDIAVEHEGRQIKATRIVLTPFVGDPKLGGFPDIAAKWYEFVLAPQIPGGIYRIRSVAPSQAGGAPAIESSVVFQAARG